MEGGLKVADGIYTSLSGALARIRHLDVLSNNLANVDTTGFKADRISFRRADPDVNRMADTFQAPGAFFPSRLIPDDKRFVQTEVPTTWFGAGPVQKTGNDLDLALTASGRVFFAIDTPKGVRYTRDGAFTTDGDGRITTSEGHPLRAVGGGGILLHPGNVNVDVLICFSCDELEIYTNGKQVGHEDFDPRRSDLLRVVKKLFPEDEAIQGLN